MADQDAIPASDGEVVALEVSESPRRRRDRLLGTGGQVVGVAGIVVCLALIVGVLAGQVWAVGAVDDVAATIDSQIAKAEPLLAQASVRIEEISGRVDTVADIATGIAADPSPGGTALDTLRTGLASVADRYEALRSNYADARETVVSVVDRLQTLDRLVPGFSIPQGPIDALSALGARLQAFDARVTDLLTIEPGQGPINQAATAVAQTATDIQTRIDGLQAGVTDVEQRLATLRTSLSETSGTIKTGITLGSVATIVLLAYVAFLHWVLVRHAGEIRRRESPAMDV